MLHQSAGNDSVGGIFFKKISISLPSTKKKREIYLERGGSERDRGGGSERDTGGGGVREIEGGSERGEAQREREGRERIETDRCERQSE